MALQQIPVTSQPNQTMQTTITINDRNVILGLNLQFNEMAGYWVMTIIDPTTTPPTTLVDSIPLFAAGVYPSANLLQQFQHLNIGEWYVVNIGDNPSDMPDSSNLGTEYILVVRDNHG